MSATRQAAPTLPAEAPPAAAEPEATIRRFDGEGRLCLPLSFAQKRIWLVQRLAPAGTAYNMPFLLRFEGTLDAGRLGRAIEGIMRRHEVLRTTFPVVAGEPLQVIHPELATALTEVDLGDLHSPDERRAELHRKALEAASEPFDLASGPLLRARLFRLGQSEDALVVCLHHIVADGWSLSLFARELTALYGGSELPELGIQYADYTLWQHQQIRGRALERRLTYWTESLRGAPLGLPLPADHPRPRTRSFRGGTFDFVLPEETTRRLRRLGRELGATPYMALLAVFEALLARYGGRDDFVLGSVIAQRNNAQTEPLIGFFVNTLALRSDVSSSASFRDLLRKVRERTLAAYENQDLPFDLLVERLGHPRRADRPELFNVLFVVQNAPAARFELPGLRVTPSRLDNGTAKFDLTLFATPSGDHFDCSFEYAADLFRRRSVARMARHYADLAAALCTRPDVPLADVPLADGLSGEPPQALVAPAAPRAPWPAEGFSNFLARRSAEDGASTALELGDERWSYRELELGANRLAHHLRHLGVRRGDRVVLFFDRSPELLVGLFAVLAAGAAYVPIDAETPAVRVRQILDATGPKLVLTGSNEATRLPATPGIDKLDVESESSLIAARPSHRPAVSLGEKDLAYVVHTSGSSGTPKAVMVEHGALANVVGWLVDVLEVDRRDRGLWKTSIAFDAVARELFPVLVVGGTLVLAPRGVERSAAELARHLDAGCITLFHCVPTLLRGVVDQPEFDRASALRAVMCGGEALPLRLQRRFHLRSEARLFNVYGPTETVVDSTCWPSRPGVDSATVPLGGPIAGTHILVLDDEWRALPPGAIGQIAIGGRGVARGYHGAPGRTAARFVPNAHASEPGARLFLTGDRGWIDDRGTLYFLGRQDRQLKIHGVRVDPREVELALEHHPAAARAVVEPWRQGGDARLVAHVVAADDALGSDPATLAGEQLVDWRQVFDGIYSGSVDAEPGTDATGWTSSFTGQPYAAEQLEAWADATARRLLALAPRAVLEIGAGTGLISHRLAPHCQAYLATDVSAPAVDRLRASMAAAGLGHIRCATARADSLQQLDAGPFDLVVLNSVVQYFPSLDYLSRVLEGANRLLAPGGRIFVGDVRDLRLAQLFHGSVELARSDDDLPVRALAWRADERRRREPELLIAPRWFELWAGGAGFEAVAELKRGQHDDEMTRFRYDVTLTRSTPRETAAHEQLPLFELRAPRELAELENRLSAWPSRALVLRGVANARLSDELRLLRRLEDEEWLARGVGELRRSLQDSPDALAADSYRDAMAVEPERLAELAERCRRQVLLAPADDVSCFDAVFLPEQSGASLGAATRCLAGAPAEFVASGPLASDPLAARAADRLIPELRRHLAERLPDAMRPAVFFVSPDLPTLPSGKLDRAALPAPADRRVSAGGFLSPRTPLEMELAELWRDVLEIDRVGLADDFFELGGNSLMATRVLSAVHSRFAVELGFQEFLLAPTLGAVAHRVQSFAAKAPPVVSKTPPLVSQAPPVVSQAPPERPARWPLSFAQRRLWFIEQLVPGNPVYNVSYAAQLTGRLELAALHAALDTVVARPDALRTRFGESDGEPYQLVDPPSAIDLPLIDLSAKSSGAAQLALEEIIEAEATRSFSLSRGPVLRTLLVRLAAVRHVLLLNLHHIVSDGWSMGVLVRELAEAYNAAVAGRETDLPQLPVQYPDFARWQAEWLRGPVLHDKVRWWRNLLEGAPDQLSLLPDSPRPARQSFAGASRQFMVPAHVLERLHDLSRRHGATLFMTLLAAFYVLLHRLSEQEDLVVGTVIANRNRSEIEPLIGFFVNALPLRVDLAGEPSFRELLGRVRRVALGAYEHQDMPFDRLVELLQVDRRMSHQAVFQVVFTLQNAPLPEPVLDGLSLRRLPVENRSAKFDISLDMREVPEGLRGTLEYDSHLFEDATAARLAARYAALLEAIADSPDSTVGRLPMLPPAERADLRRFAAGAPAGYRPDRRLEALIAVHARETPGRVAVEEGGVRITYGELYLAAGQLAAELARRGVRQGQTVGVCMERSPRLVVALVAVLRAGAAFLYLDPEHPARRCRFALRDTGAVLALADGLGRERLGEASCPVIAAEWAAEAGSASAPGPVDDPDADAYAIYTSGSTGRPKALRICHRAIVDRILANQQVLPPLGREDRFLHCYSFTYDGGIMSLFWPLAMGAKVVFAPLDELGDARSLAGRIAASDITVIDAVPAVLRDLCRQPSLAACQSLRLVVTGGEECPAEIPQQLLERLDVVFANQYGPSEATVNATSWSCDRESWRGRVSIGRPLPNTEIRIMDSRGTPCPVGVTGEMWIGGTCLSDGYVGRPELTAERFVEISEGRSRRRFYRSGDRARFRNDGQIEFLGRVDDQVQIRGMRVEPGEIAAALRAHPAVDDAAVVADEAPDGGRTLVAYGVPAEGKAETGAAGRLLRRWQESFDEVYGPSPAGDPAWNLAGWDETASQRPLPEAAMRDWVEHTVSRILALEPRRVLEVGCGTGLLLFRLAPLCEAYDACDISQLALAQVRQGLDFEGLDGRRLGHVSLHRLAAHELDRLPAASYDCIVVNSVVQYFPSLGYLQDVLDTLVERLQPDGCLFVGDVRNLHLRRHFHAAVQRARSAGHEVASSLAPRIAAAEAQETELLVAPEYFSRYARSQARLAGARLSVKRGRHDDELLRYRYDVVLAAAPGGRLTSPARAAAVRWHELEEGELQRRLAGGVPSLVVRAIPNARLREDRALLRALDSPSAQSLALSAIEAEEDERGIEPEDLWQLARAHGYGLHVTWSDVGEPGDLDALFCAGADGSALTFLEPAGEPSPAGPFSNRPLHQQVDGSLISELRRHLEQRLPKHMVPSKWLMVESLPQTAHGKLDRRALPPAVRAPSAGGASRTPPRSLAEQEMSAVWCDVLGLSAVGVHDDFFALGGHSLLAAKLVSRLARCCQIELPLRAIFEAPTIAGLSGLAAKSAAPRGPDHDAGTTAGRLLSPLQESLWPELQALKDPRDRQLTAVLRARGRFEPERLEAAIRRVVGRHPALRLRVEAAGETAGETARLEPESRVRLETYGRGLDSEERAIQEAVTEASRPLELESEGPIRFGLLRLAAARNMLFVTAHLLAVDGWSLRQLVRELHEAYAQAGTAPHEPAAAPSGPQAAPVVLAPVPTPVAVETQQAWTPANNTAGEPHKGVGRLDTRVQAEAMAALRAICTHHHMTPFTALFTCLQLGLYHLSGGRDVLVETTVAGRHSPGAENVVAPHAFDVPLPLAVEPRLCLGDLLQRARQTVIEALSLDRPIAGRRRGPVALVLHEALELPTAAGVPAAGVPAAGVPAAGDLVLEPLPELARAPLHHDLKLSLTPEAGGLRGTLRYRRSRIAEAAVRQLVATFHKVISHLDTDLSARIDTLPTSPPAEPEP